MRHPRSLGVRLTVAVAAIHVFALATVVAAGVLAGDAVLRNLSERYERDMAKLLGIVLADPAVGDRASLTARLRPLLSDDGIAAVRVRDHEGRPLFGVTAESDGIAKTVTDGGAEGFDPSALNLDVPAGVVELSMQNCWPGFDAWALLGQGAAFLAFVAAATVLLLAAATARLTRGLGVLRRSVVAMADGHPGEPSPNGGDEVGQVARAVDVLASRLRRAIRIADEDRALFRALIDGMPALVALKDDRLGYVLANRRHGEWLGWAEAAMFGRRIDDLLPADQVAGTVDAERAALATGRMQMVEQAVRRADGTSMTVLQMTFPLPAGHGRPARLGSVAFDIGAYKATERALTAADRRLQDFIGTASDWMWETDEEHRFTYISRRFYEILGQPAADFIGCTHLELAESDAADPVWRRHLADLAARRPFRDFEVAKLDALGKRVRMRIGGVPVFAGDGRFLGYRGTGRDITRERQRDAELAQAQKLTAIGELTGGIAHDFNNLLGVILTNLDLLAETLARDPGAMQAVDRAIHATLRGAELTRGLVAFARRQPLQPSRADINGLVGHLIEMLRRTLGETVEIQTKLAAGLWAGYVDPAGLESALLNLAVNARDAMPEGGVLTIETENVTFNDSPSGLGFGLAAGDYVRLAVADTGEGIPPEALSRVFEPFFTTKEVGRGSGLGLSMVYGFVKQSGGYVTVDSTPGLGTGVALYLPRAYAVTAGSENAPEGGPTSVEAPVGKGESILVVEDEVSVREAVVEILEALGYRVTAAADGPAALACLERGSRPDLLFTDMVLPGGFSGADVAQAARRRHPGLPVLFSSGHSRFGDDLDGVHLSGTGFIHKPFRRLSLAIELRRLLDAPTA